MVNQSMDLKRIIRQRFGSGWGAGGYRTVLAHAFQDFTDRTVRLFGGDAEHAEFAAMRVGDVLGWGIIGRIIEDFLITD